jgi:hypothetical protein
MFHIPESHHQSPTGALRAFQERFGRDWNWPTEWLWYAANQIKHIRAHRNEVFLDAMLQIDEWAWKSAWRPKR